MKVSFDEQEYKNKGMNIYNVYYDFHAEMD